MSTGTYTSTTGSTSQASCLSCASGEYCQFLVLLDDDDGGDDAAAAAVVIVTFHVVLWRQANFPQRRRLPRLTPALPVLRVGPIGIFVHISLDV